MSLPDVGIVVIGRNEGQRLVDCLTGLAERGNGIVYVDSGSTDGSLNAAERLGAIPHPLSTDRPFNAARARNEGAARLRQVAPNIEFIQFVDGDCIVADGWIETAREFLMKHPDAAVVCGRRRERFPERSAYNRFMDLEWNTPVGKAEASGGDAMVRRRAFDAVGGFDDRVVAGEEPELCFRLRQQNWSVWRIDSEMTFHDADLRKFSQWWKRTVRSGYGTAQIWRLHGVKGSTGLGRQFYRYLFWPSFAAVAVVAAALVSKWFLLLLLIYPAQIVRLAVAGRGGANDAWTYSIVMMLSKFAGFQGVCKYFWELATASAPHPADYK